MFHTSNRLSSLGLILSFQLFGHAVGLRSKNNLHTLNVTIRRNARFEKSEVYILNSFPDMSYERCVLECGSRPGCKAVEYRLSAKYCSLMSDTSNTVRTPGFLIVSDFDEKRRCGKTKCREREVCDSNTNTCMIKECGYLGDRCSFKGNRFGVGSKLVYDHSEQPAIRKCTECGTWESEKTFSEVTCRDIRRRYGTTRSGVYENTLTMRIYCDFDLDGGDWLVFQRRRDGSVDFYRTWKDYRAGFGDLRGEFWFGLEQLYTILKSTSAQFELRIDLEDWDGNTRFAVYDSFDLGAESDGYRLQCGNYTGTAGDALYYHSGQTFSTYDRDHCERESYCAVKAHGAWWYRAYVDSNLNGLYYKGGHVTPTYGVCWYTWRGLYYSLKKVTMQIRESC